MTLPRTRKNKALSITVVLGLAIAILAQASPSFAYTQRRTIEMRPPVPNATTKVHLNCGWHKSCVSPYPYGYGLDWGISASPSYPTTNTVYFTADALNAAPADISHMAYAIISYTTSPCKTTRVTVYNVEASGARTSTPMFHVDYEHTSTTLAGTHFWIAGKSGCCHTNPNTHVAIGTLVSSDVSGCPFSGKHVHVMGMRPGDSASSWYWSPHVTFYPHTWQTWGAIPDANQKLNGNCSFDYDTSGNACDTVFPGPTWNRVDYKRPDGLTVQEWWWSVDSTTYKVTS
jgi:hypothetical protein